MCSYGDKIRILENLHVHKKRIRLKRNMVVAFKVFQMYIFSCVFCPGQLWCGGPRVCGHPAGTDYHEIRVGKADPGQSI